MHTVYGNKLRIEVEGSAHYGFIFSYRFQKICSAEFTYFRQLAKAEIKDTLREKNVDITFSWYLLGINNFYETGNPRLKGFWGLCVGLNNTSGTDQNYSNTSFGFGAKTGFIYFATKSIGIRLQGEGLMAFNHLQELTWDSGLGVAQLGITGGIVVSLGKSKID
ncbi:MAG TPA: hypothetical protein VFP87_00095 [Chitinophagaceae bacterium]|nr:hypothetical protein [Chitinophagaceae bacterium]